jgi:hypothetical protein
MLVEVLEDSLVPDILVMEAAEGEMLVREPAESCI